MSSESDAISGDGAQPNSEPFHRWSRLSVNAPRRHPYALGIGFAGRLACGGGTSDHDSADRADAIGAILGVAAQTLLVYSRIFCAMPAVGLGLLCGPCRSVPRTTGNFARLWQWAAFGPSARCCPRPWGRIRSRSLAPSPVGQVGIARADRAARVPRGERGGNRCSRAKWVSFFSRPPPASSVATISKMPLKPPRPSSTDSTSVVIPNAKNR
jgi:hypothetical protein